MSSRVTKSRSRKVSERSVLAAYVAEGGVISMPCSRCFRLQIACKISDQSSRCAACIESGRSCDGTSVASFRESPGDVGVVSS